MLQDADAASAGGSCWTMCIYPPCCGVRGAVLTRILEGVCVCVEISFFSKRIL
jgi:hypothetical protein